MSSAMAARSSSVACTTISRTPSPLLRHPGGTDRVRDDRRGARARVPRLVREPSRGAAGGAVVRAFIAALSERHTVVRYDRIGTGLSVRSGGPLSLEAEAGVLGMLIDHLRLERCSLSASRPEAASRPPMRPNIRAAYSGSSCTAPLRTAQASPTTGPVKPLCRSSGATGGLARACSRASSCRTATPRTCAGSRASSATPPRRRWPRLCSRASIGPRRGRRSSG
jgi:hypothetical protein